MKKETIDLWNDVSESFLGAGLSVLCLIAFPLFLLVCLYYFIKFICVVVWRRIAGTTRIIELENKIEWQEQHIRDLEDELDEARAEQEEQNIVPSGAVQ